MTAGAKVARALDAATRLIVSARASLVLDEPFFGSLALRLRLVPDPGCGTAWTDGEALGYDPAFVESLPFPRLVGLVAHEVLHCSNGHPWRRGGRDPKRWNVACDYAINPILRDAGFALPDGVLLSDEYAGRSAEWIYARLPSDDGQEDGQGDGDDDGQEDGAGQGGQGDDDGDAGDGQEDGQGAGDDDDGQGQGQGAGDGQEDGQGAPAPCTDPLGEVRDGPTGADAIEAEATPEDWRRATQEAARAAMARGDLPGALQRYAEDAARPRADWRSALRRFVQETSRADYSWTRPSARHMARGMYLPALRSEAMGPLVVVVDTSGSVDSVLVGQFGAEVTAIAEDVRPSRVVVIYADSRVAHVDEYEAGETVKLNPHGGGGTDFRPAFRYVEDMEDPPAAVVYLTDLDGAFPETAPDVPTLWGFAPPPWRREPPSVPFGEVVALDG